MGNANCKNICQDDNIIHQSPVFNSMNLVQLTNRTVGNVPIEQYATPVPYHQSLPQAFRKIIQIQNAKQFIYDQKFIGQPLPPYKINQSKAIYIGQWRNGLPHGRGKVFYQDNGYFQGQFNQGKAQCSDGLFIYPEGRSYYRGNIKMNQANGNGKIVYQINKLVYIGEWRNDVPSGQGQQIYFDGSSYKGGFQNGKKNGKGKYVWSDKSSYEGQFLEGYMEGQGVQILSIGEIYQGGFKRNKRFGNGKLQTNNGVYQGHFQDDKKQGFGKFVCNDGRIYTGNFKNGKLHGRGTLTYPNGQQILGQWIDGKYSKVQSLKNQIITKTMPLQNSFSLN